MVSVEARPAGGSDSCIQIYLRLAIRSDIQTISRPSMAVSYTHLVKLMGLNPEKIPYLKYFLDNEIKLEDIAILKTLTSPISARDITGYQLDYLPSEHWKNLREDEKWLA